MSEAIDLSEFYDKEYKPCAIGRILERLSPEERPTLQAALDERSISHFSIVRWIKKRGLETTDTTLATHRNARCRCVRD